MVVCGVHSGDCALEGCLEVVVRGRELVELAVAASSILILCGRVSEVNANEHVNVGGQLPRSSRLAVCP